MKKNPWDEEWGRINMSKETLDELNKISRKMAKLKKLRERLICEAHISNRPNPLNTKEKGSL